MSDDIDISEISKLINIRNYMYNIMESMTINTSQSREVGKMLPALDKLILSKITNNDFRKMINYFEPEKDNKIQNIKSPIR